MTAVGREHADSAARSQSSVVRGTQSLVHLVAACWRRPGLLGRELAWRWLFGVPTLLLLYYAGVRVVAMLLRANTGIANFSLEDPMAAAQVIGASAAAIEPEIVRILEWLAPVLAIAWAIASGVGRSFVIRALAPSARFRPGTLIVLQLMRIIALGGSFLWWYAAVGWAARATLYAAEPNMVGYFALVIVFSLGIFTLWALVSWVSAIAPLLAMLEDRRVLSSLRASVHLGRRLTAKLVEVNFVLGIVKLALVVLAMVFSATPLPWASAMNGTPLYLWWAGVTVLYFAASDFFQVARLAAFIEFWREFRTAH